MKSGVKRKKGATMNLKHVILIVAVMFLILVAAVIHIDHVCREQAVLLDQIRAEQESQQRHLEDIDCWLIDLTEERAVIPDAIPVINETERDLIERVVAAEARGECFEGLCAVAQTIKDRGDSWGMSYTEVVSAPYQFAKPYNGEISDDVKQAVSCVFDQGYRVFDETTTHFYAWDQIAPPSWTKEKVYLGNIGGHAFYGI